MSESAADQSAGKSRLMCAFLVSTSNLQKKNSLFPKRGNRNAKRTEKHKIKKTQGKT